MVRSELDRREAPMKQNISVLRRTPLGLTKLEPSSSFMEVWRRLMRAIIRTPGNLCFEKLENMLLTVFIDVSVADDIGATQAPKVSVSPHNVEIVKGENIYIRCSPLGHPAPNITWKFSNGLLPHNTQQVSFFGLPRAML